MKTTLLFLCLLSIGYSSTLYYAVKNTFNFPISYRNLYHPWINPLVSLNGNDLKIGQLHWHAEPTCYINLQPAEEFFARVFPEFFKDDGVYVITTRNDVDLPEGRDRRYIECDPKRYEEVGLESASVEIVYNNNEVANLNDRQNIADTTERSSTAYRNSSENL